jgi:hypothetical protein
MLYALHIVFVRATRTVHLDHPNILWRVQIMKLFIMQVFPLSCPS